MTDSSSVRSPLRTVVLTLSVLAFVGGVASGCGGGDDETSTAPATTAAATQPGDGQAASGAELFSNNCQSCHGPNGAGGHVGPDLQKSAVAEDLARVEEQVRNGGGAMPPFADVLSDEEIGTVAHYVVEQIAPKG
jgi:quinohemoprotein ethanol dehydrogenase